MAFYHCFGISFLDEKYFSATIAPSPDITIKELSFLPKASRSHQEKYI
jgi:hypothetical protein